MKAFTALFFLAGPTATLAQDVPAAPDYFFKFSALNVATCPANSSPTTSATCEAAAPTFDYNNLFESRVYGWGGVVSDENLPPGCFCDKTNAGDLCSFNTHAGAANSHYFVACETVPADPEGYELSRLNEEECPGTSTPLDSTTCAAAATAMAGYSYGGDSSWSGGPPGCFCSLYEEDGYNYCSYNPAPTTGAVPGYFVACAEATSSTTPAPTPCEQSTIKLEILTDSCADETSWDLVDSCSSTAVASVHYERPSPNTGIRYIYEYCIPSTEHRFTIRDSYGDGLNGGGEYKLFVDGELKYEGGDFNYDETVVVFGDNKCASSPPTSAPWDLVKTQVSADFSNGTGRVDVTYRIGKGRRFGQQITEGLCAAKGREVPADVVSSTVAPGVDDTDPLMQEQIVRHQINMSALVTSDIYTSEPASIGFCQTAELKTSEDDGDYVISQHQMDVNVTLNMTATFETDVTLVEGTVSQANDTVDLEDQVMAYPCTSLDDSSLKGGAVGPNQMVHVCVTTRSVDIQIKSLDTMNAKGRASGDNLFKIIDNGVAIVDAITKIRSNATFHVVQTRLPINKVAYASGNRVDITGTLTLEFGGQERRLAVAAATPGRRLQVPQDAADEEAAGFSLDLALAPAEEDRAPVAVASAAAAGAVRATVLVAAAAVALLG